MAGIINNNVDYCSILGNNSHEIIDMKLEEQLRQAIRIKQYSLKTEENYVGWYWRYVLWHKSQRGWRCTRPRWVRRRWRLS